MFSLFTSDTIVISLKEKIDNAWVVEMDRGGGGGGCGIEEQREARRERQSARKGFSLIYFNVSGV